MGQLGAIGLKAVLQLAALHVGEGLCAEAVQRVSVQRVETDEHHQRIAGILHGGGLAGLEGADDVGGAFLGEGGIDVVRTQQGSGEGRRVGRGLAIQHRVDVGQGGGDGGAESGGLGAGPIGDGSVAALGGGLSQLGIQLLGLIVVDAYVLAVMFVIFKVIDKTIGLRVPAEVEIDGLDIHEHGLASAYAGFAISDANSAAMVPNENTDLGEDDASKASAKQMDAAVPVVREPAVIHDGIYDTGMHKVSIIAKLSKFDQLKSALNDLGVTGMTVTQVMGCGIQKGTTEKYRGVPVDSTLLPKIKVEVIVSKISVDSVVEAAKKALYTGHIGDGKIFVYNVTRVVKIRTGEEDFAALQDVE